MPPRALFADTFYWIALLNPRDAFHAAALAYGRTLDSPRHDRPRARGSVEPFQRRRALLARQSRCARSQPEQRSGRGYLADIARRLRRRARAVRGAHRQELQPDRLPVDARD